MTEPLFCPKEYKLHIFDFDDTLCDTTKAYNDSLAFVFSKFSIPSSFEPLWFESKSFYGSSSFFDIWKYFIKKSQVLLDPFHAAQLHAGKYFEFLSVVPGSKDYLRYLKNSGLLLALVSNGNSTVQRKKINMVGIDELIPEPYWFISGDFLDDHAKPSGKMLELAMLKASVTSIDSVYYGDKEIDALAAEFSGTSFIKVAPEKGLRWEERLDVKIKF